MEKRRKTFPPQKTEPVKKKILWIRKTFAKKKNERKKILTNKLQKKKKTFGKNSDKKANKPLWEKTFAKILEKITWNKKLGKKKPFEAKKKRR